MPPIQGSGPTSCNHTLGKSCQAETCGSHGPCSCPARGARFPGTPSESHGPLPWAPSQPKKTHLAHMEQNKNKTRSFLSGPKPVLSEPAGAFVLKTDHRAPQPGFLTH